MKRASSLVVNNFSIQPQTSPPTLAGSQAKEDHHTGNTVHSFPWKLVVVAGCMFMSDYQCMLQSWASGNWRAAGFSPDPAAQPGHTGVPRREPPHCGPPRNRARNPQRVLVAFRWWTFQSVENESLFSDLSADCCVFVLSWPPGSWVSGRALVVVGGGPHQRSHLPLGIYPPAKKTGRCFFFSFLSC